jgi:hypothetical protein
MITILYDNLGYSFTKVAKLLGTGLHKIGYKQVDYISIHALYNILQGTAIAIYDTKLYESKAMKVKASVKTKTIMWLDSPASPKVLNARAYEDGCHITTLPYWYEQYKKNSIPVSGYIPRPIDYDTAIKVSNQPREKLCKDIWGNYGRYILTVGSDQKLNPSKPPRKGFDAYDQICEVVKRKLGINCLYSGSWDLKNANKIAYTGRLSEYDLMRYMRCSEAFVWTTRGEGFGMPPVEAQSVGAIVVSSKAPINFHITGIKFNYSNELEAYDPEMSVVNMWFKLFDYDLKELYDAVEYAINLKEDEKEEIRIKGYTLREYYRPDLIALALTQV